MENFPEVTCSVTILRAPIFFARLWGWVRHRLTPTMERKVRILGEDFEQGLREHSGLERKALPSFLGGQGAGDLAMAWPVPRLKRVL
eukprot:g29374.t1